MTSMDGEVSSASKDFNTTFSETPYESGKTSGHDLEARTARVRVSARERSEDVAQENHVLRTHMLFSRKSRLIPCTLSQSHIDPSSIENAAVLWFCLPGRALKLV